MHHLWTTPARIPFPLLTKVSSARNDYEVVKDIITEVNAHNKKQNDTANALKKAFRLREEYASLGTIAQHDTLQQTINLANIMIHSGAYQDAANLIEFCETFILDYSDIKSFDYGICQFLRGIMTYRQRNPVLAETALLEAENILSSYTEDDGYYLKNTRHFLYSLYSRWRKPELAEKYKKLL